MHRITALQSTSHERHWLNGHLERGGNNGGWFYGEQLLVSVTASGVVTDWVVGQAQIDDRWLLEAFVSTRQGYMRVVGPEVVGKKRYRANHVASPESFGPAITAGMTTGLPYLADQGFNGDRWHHHWLQEYGATVITVPPTSVDHAWDDHDKRWLSSHRQIVETVFSRLSEVFRLKRLNAHSDWGKFTRLAAIMAAYNIGIYFNRMLNRDDGALATLIV